MINDDVLRKWILRHDTGEPLESRMNRFNRDILRIKLGFKGIGNRHLSLIGLDQLKRGNRIILDYYIDINGGPESRSREVSPKIFQLVGLKSMGDEHNLGILIGIGEGTDLHGDPDLSLELGRTYMLDTLNQFPTVLRLDSIGRYVSSDKRVR